MKIKILSQQELRDETIYLQVVTCNDYKQFFIKIKNYKDIKQFKKLISLLDPKSTFKPIYIVNKVTYKVDQGIYDGYLDSQFISLSCYLLSLKKTVELPEFDNNNLTVLGDK